MGIEFQLFCEFECFIPKMWLWNLIFLCHKIYSFANRMNPSSKHKEDLCACFFHV